MALTTIARATILKSLFIEDFSPEVMKAIRGFNDECVQENLIEICSPYHYIWLDRENYIVMKPLQTLKKETVETEARTFIVVEWLGQEGYFFFRLVGHNTWHVFYGKSYGSIR